MVYRGGGGWVHNGLTLDTLTEVGETPIADANVARLAAAADETLGIQVGTSGVVQLQRWSPVGVVVERIDMDLEGSQWLIGLGGTGPVRYLGLGGAAGMAGPLQPIECIP